MHIHTTVCQSVSSAVRANGRQNDNKNNSLHSTDNKQASTSKVLGIEHSTLVHPPAIGPGMLQRTASCPSVRLSVYLSVLPETDGPTHFTIPWTLAAAARSIPSIRSIPFCLSLLVEFLH